MGGGKTSAAITYMNEHKDKKFIFITPYLGQVERVKRSCPSMSFVAPVAEDFSTKSESLQRLIRTRQNIVTTHQLFERMNKETEELVRAGGYTLIVDEALGAINANPIKKEDAELFLEFGYLRINEEGYYERTEKEYNGTALNGYFKALQEARVHHSDDEVWVCALPAEIFECFEEVIVLTYMFDAQLHKYYYDLKHIPYKYIGIKRTLEGGELIYRFTENLNEVTVPDSIYELSQKIHIFDGNKINSIGDVSTALSSTWYQKGTAKKCERVRKNIYNVFQNIYGAKSKDALWTTFKRHQDGCTSKRYKKAFLSCNARATNDFANRHYVAYCINVFYNPFLVQHMKRKGIELDEDRYALSEMVQFIFRSAIRNGEDIWVYVPSARMRKLLQDWLKNGLPTKERAAA